MEALVTAAKNGDKEAFVQLIRINQSGTSTKIPESYLWSST